MGSDSCDLGQVPLCVCVYFNLNNNKTVYKQYTDTDYKNQMTQKESTLTVGGKSPHLTHFPLGNTQLSFYCLFFSESFPCIYRDGEMVKR